MDGRLLDERRKEERAMSRALTRALVVVVASV
jgi:hypothetical protein